MVLSFAIDNKCHGSVLVDIDLSVARVLGQEKLSVLFSFTLETRAALLLLGLKLSTKFFLFWDKWLDMATVSLS